MKKFFRCLKCWMGLHDWHSDSANINNEIDGSTVAIIWWECPHCGKSKLKFIGK